MNKLLKITLLTAIMATSGMCGDRCQRTTFTEATEYKLGHIASHDSTWITENTSGGRAYIKGDVKITDRSRWIHNKGKIRLEGKGNIIDNSEVINDGVMDVYNEGKLNIIKSIVSVGDGAGIGAYVGGILNIEDKSTVNLMDSAYIFANNGGILDVTGNSTIRLTDSAYIQPYDRGTITINEGSIFDARDSKNLSKWNTFDGTFNMKAGSIMYLPSTDIDDDKKATDFTITLTSGDKPVELRYIQHIDITCDGLCPNVTHSGCKYKLSGWEKGTTDIDDPDNPGNIITVPCLQEPNTGIEFNGNTDKVRLTPIYTWSVSTKCNGEDVKILESRDLQCCDDILW